MGVACTGRGKIVGEIFVPAGGGGTKRSGERLAFCTDTRSGADIFVFWGDIAKLLGNICEYSYSCAYRNEPYLSSNLAIKVFLLVV